MDLDDILDEELELDYDLKKDYLLYTEQLEVEQALISKKSSSNVYSVERQFVNAKEFRDKFDKLPVNSVVQQKLYRETGRLLEKVDGQEEERMLAISARTGDFIVDNFDRPGSIKGTGFTDEEYKKIQQCSDFIIIVHNHSLNGRPSGQDLIAYAKNDKIRLSLIACHDGTIYAIYYVKSNIEEIYEDLLRQAKYSTSDMEEAKRLATTALYKMNEKLGQKQKIFKVERL